MLIFFTFNFSLALFFYACINVLLDFDLFLDESEYVGEDGTKFMLFWSFIERLTLCFYLLEFYYFPLIFFLVLHNPASL